MFSLGGVAGLLVGRLFDGTLLPVVGVMLTASSLANVIALTIPVKE